MILKNFTKNKKKVDEMRKKYIIIFISTRNDFSNHY